MMRIYTTVGTARSARRIPVTPKPVTVGNSTNSTTTAYATAIPVKDDPSVAPTLETSCTLDTAPWTQEILILMPF